MDSEKINNLHSLDSENDSESSGITTKATNGMGEDCRVTSKKRKLSVSHPQSPRKRQRSASGPPEVPVQDVTARGTKRKASTGRETPSKRQRGGNATDKPTKVCLFASDFEAKYTELGMLGTGGFGSVYAGYRKTDHLPVAIKHIQKADVENHPVIVNGRTLMVPMEVLLMVRATGGQQSGRKSAAVSLLDWYELDEELLLVMERPVPSVNLLHYLENNDGPLTEDQAKNIMKQLVEAATEMLSVGVFHRDIKSENVLVETGSDVPRVRVIDFGCGCFVQKSPYSSFSGTSAYVPPELYRQGTYEAGPTTVWQLGALLYELLHGHKQFDTSEFLRKKIKVSKKLSQDCKNLLKVCLAVNPKQRATLEQIKLHPWFT